jgi:hypothetical protein
MRPWTWHCASCEGSLSDLTASMLRLTAVRAGHRLYRHDAQRTLFGRSGVRRKALRYIPGVAGMDWRDVLGSDVLPGAERLRGKEHDRKLAAGSRYRGRCARDPRDTVKAKLPEA